MTHNGHTDTTPIGAGRTALLIDDDPDFLAAAGAHLRSLGFGVVESTSVADGKHAFDAHRPDLAVVDLMLDEPDGGFVLCHLIKSAAPEVPVIVCSAVKSECGMDFDVKTEQERAWIKADACMAKPVRFEQLTGEIERLLGAATGAG
jgi:DNA-binding response OmpR family regulator